MSNFQSLRIGSCLVVGGCGFVGYHVVKRLQEAGYGPITVISRNPNQNRIPEILYIKSDVTNDKSLVEILSVVKPEVVFHLAAPRAVDGMNSPGVFYETIVRGTMNLIDAAKNEPAVAALVYTSTPAVNQNYEHYDLDENGPLWNESSKTFPYYKAKAVAETAVLQANSPLKEGVGLLTATLRLPMVYGEKDNQGIPGQLEVFQRGQTKIQLGDGSNKVEPLYAPNAADAHILAAKALLASRNGSLQPRVDGEAFNITNGDPKPFWEFSRHVWQLVGDQTKPEEVTVVSARVALGLVSMVEWAFYLFTFGFREPPLNMSRLYIQYAIYNATYSIEKARTRLGYSPKVDLDASLRSSIASTLASDPERYEGLKLRES